MREGDRENHTHQITLSMINVMNDVRIHLSMLDTLHIAHQMKKETQALYR